MDLLDERRPGQGNGARSGHEPVRLILSRNASSISMGLVGCLCVALPIAFEAAGDAYWPLVIAYGGCLVGIAIVGGVGL